MFWVTSPGSGTVLPKSAGELKVRLVLLGVLMEVLRDKGGKERRTDVRRADVAFMKAGHREICLH